VNGRRLFFALWPDEAMQAALAEATREIVAAAAGAAIPARKFHFTLAFLGAVPESRTRELGEIAARVASAFQDVAAVRDARIAIALDQVEYWRRSQILCATATTEASEAIALTETLKRQLTANGLAPDLELKFRPHVTLARKVRTRIAKTRIPSLIWSFSEFVLVDSQLGPQGSSYSVLASYSLLRNVDVPSLA
jgi:2'-5' RNA ligase